MVSKKTRVSDGLGFDLFIWIGLCIGGMSSYVYVFFLGYDPILLVNSWIESITGWLMNMNFFDFL